MISADQAKRISRGRAIALSYQAMTGLSMDDGIDTAAVDCIADLLHAAVAEPFDRAGLGAADKAEIAGRILTVAQRHFESELEGE